MWTADGRYIVFTSSEGASSGIASQGGISTTMELWALSLRDQDRDPINRDIDNEAQGLAAEAAARQNTGRGGGAAAAVPAPEVRIDWSGLARRARQLTVPGTAIGGLTASPEGHSVALTASNAGAGGRGGAPDPTAGMYIINVESGQLTRVPPAPRTQRRAPGEADAAAAAADLAAAAAAWRSRATAARCTSARASGLFAATINLARCWRRCAGRGAAEAAGLAAAAVRRP